MSAEYPIMSPSVRSEVRILLIEDAQIDVELNIRQMRGAGFAAQYRSVDNESALLRELDSFKPDLVLSDYTLPGFDGLRALEIVRERHPDLPFVFVSGTIGEERAIEALKRGATDYVLKGNLARLPPAVLRALRDAEALRERRRQEAQIQRLTRVLRMLSGINGSVIRIRDRAALFEEACRLAVTIGGYSIAVALLKKPDGPSLEVIASNGLTRSTLERLSTAVGRAAPAESSVVGRAMATGQHLVCDTTTRLESGEALELIFRDSTFRCAAVLPLLLDGTGWGTLILVAPGTIALVEEELAMLRELAANLSFALQFLHKDNEVRFLSFFDPNTGLAKRRLFCDRLSRRISRSIRAGHHAVAVIDIGKLSVINDSFGRHFGDRLLQLIAERLRRAFQETDCIGHLSGGTFAVALETGTSELDALATMQNRLAAVFDRPFEIELRSVPVIIRSGIAVGPEDGQSADSLVQNAEAALGDARSGEQRLVHYSNQHRSELVDRLALEHKLRMAIEGHQFELHYQPEYCARTGRIDSVEGLIRWRPPEGGLVPPAEFLPLLESTGLIAAVGDWVIGQAAQDARMWRSLDLPPVRIAVNVSPRELRQPQFADRFLEHLRKCGAVEVDIEITEGALLEDSDLAVRELETLRNAGVRIAIDDFGTGYSSLSRLADLPIDTLKIDRTFTMRLASDPVGATLVSTIITLAHAIGMNVVAEGVETDEQRRLLCDLGCDHLQGYLMSKPLPAEELIGLLRANH